MDRPRTLPQPARERVLDRIRRALAEGDEDEAMRVAQELQRRWRTCAARREADARRG